MKGIDDIADVPNWWVRQEKYTILKPLALKLACCHASSANTERFFSRLGRLISPTRTCLSLQMIQHLIGIRIFRLASEKTINSESSYEIYDGEADRDGSFSQSGDVSSQSLGDSFYDWLFEEPAAESAILDDSVLDAAGDPVELTEFYSSAEFVEFTRLVNYNIGPVVFVEPSSSQVEQEGETEDELSQARRLMEDI